VASGRARSELSAPTISLSQNYWVSGLCPSPGSLNTRKHNVSETGSVFIFRWGGETPTQLVPLERATPQSVDQKSRRRRQNLFLKLYKDASVKSLNADLG
jgi:hypothetical protein